MRIPRLYVPEATTSGETISVTGQTAHHAVQVLRLRPGSMIRIFNGHGPEWNALLLGCKRSEIQLEVGTPVDRLAEASLSITLAQGIARNDRMDLILQKSVELGVSRIQPLWMQRCQAHVRGERLEKRIKHWHGVIISACEQCGRGILPELCTPEEYSTWLTRRNNSSLGLMLQPESKHVLHNMPAPEQDVDVLVGPEGGLTTEEQRLAEASGFQGIRLGQRILRTETAAVVALAGIHTLWGDFLDHRNQGIP